MKLLELQNIIYAMKIRQMGLTADYTLQKKLSMNQKTEQLKLPNLKNKF